MMKRMIKALFEYTRLYVNDTYKTAPHPYEQLLTVLGPYDGLVKRLTFCLLTGKTTAQYRQLYCST